MFRKFIIVSIFSPFEKGGKRGIFFFFNQIPLPPLLKGALHFTFYCLLFTFYLQAEKVIIPDWTRLNFSAREEAFNLSNAADRANPGAANINPAALHGMTGSYFSFAHSDRFGFGILEDAVLAARSIRPDVNVFVFFQNIKTGEIPVTDVERYRTNLEPRGTGAVLDSNGDPYIFGYFAEYRRAYGFGVQADFTRRLKAGLSIKRIEHFFDGNGLEDKYLNSMIHQAASGFSADVGLTFLLTKDINLAFSVRNGLQTGLRWNTQYDYEEFLPMELIPGLGYDKKIGAIRLRAFASSANSEKYSSGFNGGAEISFMDIVSFRAGLSKDIINLGLGVRTIIRGVPFFLDYSITPVQDMTTHKFSISITNY